MQAHDGRVARAGPVTDRFDQQALDHGAVAAVELDRLGPGQGLFRQPGVVVAERAQPLRFDRGQRIGMQVVAAEHDDVVLAGDVELVVEARAAVEFVEAAVGEVDARDMGDQALLDQGEHVAAVGRPARMREAAVDRCRNPRLAAGHVDHGQLPWRVVDPLVLAALQVGDARAVGAPSRIAFPVRIEVGARERGQLPLPGAGLRRDQVDVVVQVTIGICAALGHVGDGLAVGRPGRQLFVVCARGQQLGLAAGDVEQVEVLASRIEIAGAIFLELVAFGDDRRRVLWLLRIGRKLGVDRDHGQLFRIGRPDEILDAVGEIGQAPRFAAVGRHQPDLGRRVVARLVGVRRAIRQEGDPGAVIRPARLPFVAVPRVGQLGALAAVVAYAPEVGVALVVVHVGAADRVGDPVAVVRKRRIAEVGDAGQVGRLEQGILVGMNDADHAEHQQAGDSFHGEGRDSVSSAIFR